MTTRLPKSLAKLTGSDKNSLILGELEYNVLAMLNSGEYTADEIEADVTRSGRDRWLDVYYAQFQVTDDARPVNWRHSLFGMHFFDKARGKQQLNHETYLGKTIPPVDSPACPKCGSNNVVAEGKYNRGFDEAGTSYYLCRNCGRTFPLN
jgi:DNA-directed RNA polymerase subunit M/transcription elongation factor TFIIS